MNALPFSRAAPSCANPTGWLPWRTLGLPPQRDAAARSIWYVVSPGWHLPNSTTSLTINSDTPAQLTLDGRPVIALIIAAGAALDAAPNAAQQAAGCVARTQNPALSVPPNPRDYLECYTTTFRGGGNTLRDRAAACMQEGWRLFRFDAASLPPGSNRYDARERMRQVQADCRAAREGVGPGGNFMVDFHQRFTFADALRGCRLIEEFEPYFVEDPVEMNSFQQDIPKLRQMTSVPLAAGEEWGDRYDFIELVENHDLDFIRISLPNVGGITELIRVMAMCESHDVGIVPHFTGPIATAAQAHALATFPFTVRQGSRLSFWVM